MAPNAELMTEYLSRLELMFFADAAGTATKKPTNRLPTIFMPVATTRETSRRYKRSVSGDANAF